MVVEMHPYGSGQGSLPPEHVRVGKAPEQLGKGSSNDCTRPTRGLNRFDSAQVGVM
jgi:hypothetical protein